MPADTVFLLTHSGDFFTVDLVAAAVRARGARAVRVDTDRYPLPASLTVHLRRSGVRVELRDGRRVHRLDRARALWVRRLWPSPPRTELNPAWAPACEEATRTALFDALPLCRGARIVNPVAEAERAESKLLQLDLARRLGFAVPETLVTNAAGEVRALGRRHRQVVTKLLRPLVQSMEAHPSFHYTQLLARADFGALGGLRHAPQVFQPRVPKRRELRVICVGARLFVGAVDASHSPRAQVDWRRATAADGLRWERARLPAPVAARVRKLMRALGLTYGALDFIVTPAGEHVFLELNPSGEWGWLERDLGFDISGALAGALLGARA